MSKSGACHLGIETDEIGLPVNRIANSKDRRRSPSPPRSEGSQPRVVINIIAGGITGSSKRPPVEQAYYAQVIPKTNLALSFTQADRPVGKPQDNEPLVIIGIIDGFEVHHI
jgi:hypothetical protein